MSTQKSNAMNLDIHGNQYKPKIIMSIILLATFLWCIDADFIRYRSTYFDERF